MKAKRLYYLKETDIDGDLLELVVWEVSITNEHPEGVRYRFAFIPTGSKVPRVLYDNHHPIGHHKHIGSREYDYPFEDVDQLLIDFRSDIAAWKKRRGD